MVFSSVPASLDPPIWHHHLHHHHHQSESGADHENAHVPPLLPPPPPLPARGGGGGGGGGGSGTACTDSSKPGSMSNRAKLAKLSGQPDPALKCPRCESTNTKFCYFNNYNLSQPRHFCKTCRRYWTRGGALRNVPVGGGCRRNKRSKSGSSSRTKSPATSLASISALLTPKVSCTTDHNLCHLTLPPPKLPFLPSLHHLTDHYGTFGGIHNANGSTTTAGNDIDHLIQIGSSYSNGKFAENWRMHQSPFLETPNTGIYQFEMSEGAPSYGGAVTSDYLGTRAVDSGATQAVVEGVPKVEDNSTYQGLNLSKNLLGNQSETENQYYSLAGINSNAWINASHEFASSSTSHVYPS